MNTSNQFIGGFLAVWTSVKYGYRVQCHLLMKPMSRLHLILIGARTIFCKIQDHNCSFKKGVLCPLCLELLSLPVRTVKPKGAQTKNPLPEGTPRSGFWCFPAWSPIFFCWGAYYLHGPFRVFQAVPFQLALVSFSCCQFFIKKMNVTLCTLAICTGLSSSWACWEADSMISMPDMTVILLVILQSVLTLLFLCRHLVDNFHFQFDIRAIQALS